MTSDVLPSAGNVQVSSVTRQNFRDSKPPLIIIVGPTAVGKTEISIKLAEQLNGEIVSADSRLFYRGMDIGTAKPSLEERFRVPHHLIDIVNPDGVWSLVVFQKAAAEEIAEIYQRGKLPFLVGGTGQYIRAVTHGWSPPSTAPNPRLRVVLEGLAESQGKYWLNQRLALLDPLAAEMIDPRNLRRTIRALEVIFSTGHKFTEQRGKSESSYHLLTIGLTRPRPVVYARLDARIEAMFNSGLLDEVNKLLSQGFSPDLPSMSAIGYRQCSAVLKGEMSLEQAKTQMRRFTRLFIRRQANWFKIQDKSIHWFDLEKEKVADIEALIRSFLKDVSF
jgi:tRNA dimethylallyltransferase